MENFIINTQVVYEDMNVEKTYYKNYLDTLLNPVTDTLIGHRVVKIEEVRQKSSENNYRETVEVK